MLLSPPLVAGAPVAQLDRASASGAEGHRFKSCQAHQQTARDSSRTQISATHIPGGPLAQLVEQLTLNQRAVGSTPTRPTTNQPLTHHPPSSRSPCRHSVGSKAEKYIFWPSQAGPQIYIDEAFLNLTQGMRYDCAPSKNKSSKLRFVDKTFLTDHVPRAPPSYRTGAFLRCACCAPVKM